MKEEISKRLIELRAEYQTGQKMIAELEARQTTVNDTLLRISGAIQVLEELLNENDGRKDPEMPSASEIGSAAAR